MGCAAIMEHFFCHYGCDMNAWRLKKEQGTSLHLAAYYAHGDVVEVLLKHGADGTATNKYKETALESSKIGQQDFESGTFEFQKARPSGADDSALLNFSNPFDFTRDPIGWSRVRVETRDPNGWPSWDAVIRLLTAESNCTTGT
jgi:hypothetical protein